MIEVVKKKKYFLLMLLVIIVLFIWGISSSFALDTSLVTFELNGEDIITINVGDTYVEQGAKLFVNGEDRTKDMIIDTTDVDINTPGTYYVIYKYVTAFSFNI